MARGLPSPAQFTDLRLRDLNAEPARALSHFGGVCERIAVRTVFRAMPSRSAIALTPIPSARWSRRISAQSSCVDHPPNRGILYGARISLIVGIGAVLISMLIGGAIGLVAGYFRGKWDALTSIIGDSMLAFPPLVFLLGMVAVLEASVRNVTIALAVLSIPTYISLTRANTMVFAQREFVAAARALGASKRRIILRELAPNVAVPVLSYAFTVVAVLIVAEASLSFLGLSIQRPNPTWGNMIAAGQSDFERHPHLVFVPGGFLFLTVFALNGVGDSARRRTDARQSKLLARSHSWSPATGSRWVPGGCPVAPASWMATSASAPMPTPPPASTASRTRCGAPGSSVAIASRSWRRTRSARPTPPNALSDTERAEVLAVLRSSKYRDLTVAQVWALLLDDGTYWCSISKLVLDLDDAPRLAPGR